MRSAAPHSYDVLGLGCAALDEVLYVPSYPARDGKARVTHRERYCGGLTGNALVAAARLGARCAYAGCLGNDDASSHIARNFLIEGVDISHASRSDDAAVVHSTIIVGEDTGSRNIFYVAEGTIGAHPTLPAEEVIRASRVLLIDHYGMQGNLRAARIARAAGVAVLADFEDTAVSCFAEVLPLVNHLILSAEMAQRITGQSGPGEAALALWAADRAVVVVTCGANGCWSLSAEHDRQPRYHPAFNVVARDTTGCGDVFHGAYAAVLARGEPLEERIRLASAAAALHASQTRFPSLAAVRAFLASSAANHPSP